MVSVIVPIYKVEEYLNRCIDSILAQTYSNLEIILVDDGSPDNCPAICDEYAKKDNRIKVVHKENGGLSSARNAGIMVATGEYIAFVDSDDWLDKSFIATLKKYLIDNNADMAACAFCRTKEDTAKRNSFDKNVQIVLDKYYAIFDENSYAGYSCNKLFKTSIIKNNNLKFDEKIFNGEDFLFTLQYITYANKTAFINQDLYFYFFRDDSIMNTVRLSDRFVTIICAREKALNILKENAPNCYGVCKASYLSILCKIKYMAYLDIKNYKDLYLEVSQKLKKERKGLFLLKRVSIKTKLKLFFMINFPKTAIKLYKKKVVV